MLTAVFGVCYQLTLPLVISGGSVMALPTSSSGCALNWYLAGETVTLAALPAVDYVFHTWAGTLAASAAATRSFNMPASAVTMYPVFRQCVPPSKPDLSPAELPAFGGP